MHDEEHGPQMPAVLALISRARTLTGDEITRLADTWTAAWADGDAARDAGDAAWAAAMTDSRRTVGAAARITWAAGDAARDAWAAGDAARDAWAAGDAVGVAALALAVRDLIPDDVYRTLTGPWAEVVGPAHPDDAPAA
jgi:hypothetical protein